MLRGWLNYTESGKCTEEMNKYWLNYIWMNPSSRNSKKNKNIKNEKSKVRTHLFNTNPFIAESWATFYRFNVQYPWFFQSHQKTMGKLVKGKRHKTFLKTSLKYIRKSWVKLKRQLRIWRIRGEGLWAMSLILISIDKFKLIKFPQDVIDYIILYELCHLKIKEHLHCNWDLVR